MSDIRQRNSSPVQITTDFDVSKIFLMNNRYENNVYIQNSGYSTLTLRAGTVLGRITNTGTVRPSISGVLDGSQIPIGILAQDVVLLAGAQQIVSMCIAGDIAAAQVIFQGGDTFDTITAGRRNLDHLQLYGLIVRFSTSMTDYDN